MSSIPLSARSDQSLNRLEHALNPIEKCLSDLDRCDQANNPSISATSSPFQTEVAQSSFRQSLKLSSPVRGTISRCSSTSNTFSFQIHEDGPEMHMFAQEARSRERTPVEAEEIPPPTTHWLAGEIGESGSGTQLESAEKTSPVKSDIDVEHSRQCLEVDEHNSPSIASDNDTCFSSFSAVPNVDMTLFAKITSPVSSRSGANQRHPCSPSTPHRNKRRASSRSPSPTPQRAQAGRSGGDTTNLLLDFTQHSNAAVKSMALESPSKHKRDIGEPNLLSFINSQRIPSPSKGVNATPRTRRPIMSLLDFELPSQPTPRSVPTITIREMESMKSRYLSEISSLRASLSGREAEVDSLKKAVNDAERRVGEAQEAVREERSAREHVEDERQEWNKKRNEIEAVLQSVRDEFVYAEREKEDLLEKLEESARLRDEMAAKLREATHGSRKKVDDDEAVARQVEDLPIPEDVIAERVNAQLDEKMESLARELHAVYKKKHENKVSVLKKTYEARSEKKCSELQARINDLQELNEKLQSGNTMVSPESSPEALSQADHSAALARLDAQNALLEEQKAKLAGLTQELQSTQSSNSQLILDLEQERVEKGELVAAVDEMLALQADMSTVGVVEDLRKSVSRGSSGLRGPGFAAARSSGIPGKSRMLANIERMGSTRGQ